MRVGLFTDTYYPEINGVANSVYQLKKELEDRGNQVFVFTVSNPGVNEREDHVYRMKSIACPLIRERRMGCTVFRHWFDLISSLRLDVIHTQTEFFVGHIGRKAAEKLNIPHIHTYHTIYEDYTHYLRIPGNKKLKGMIRSMSRICCGHADEVIVPTDKVKRLLQSYGVKRPVIVQPTGIWLSKFDMADRKEVMDIKAKYNIEPQQHVLVSVGRLSREKNLQELIGHMEKITSIDREARLLIVGDGPERANLERLVIAKNLGRFVVFTGNAAWKHVQNYYSAGDVFTCASTSETQGLTYAEALACGKPILVRHDACLDNLLQDGINGYSYHNEKEFIERYCMLFGSGKLREMGQAAKKSVESMSAKIFGKNMEQIYMELIKRKKGFKEKGAGKSGTEPGDIYKKCLEIV